MHFVRETHALVIEHVQDRVPPVCEILVSLVDDRRGNGWELRHVRPDLRAGESHYRVCSELARHPRCPFHVICRSTAHTFGIAVAPDPVDNDVNIMALGERALSWPDCNDLIFVKAATGIGAGIISDGTLRRGAKGATGDVGHVYVQRAAGRACRCSKIGCLEAFAGIPAIIQTLRQDGLKLETGGELVESVRQGNLDAARSVRESGRAIGEMLNACVSILNPTVIVVGGQLAQSGESLLAGIREQVYSRSSPLVTRDLLIAQSRSGSDAGILGAATLAVEHVLSAAEINAVLQSRQSGLTQDATVLP